MKFFANVICLLLVFPFAAVCWLERRFRSSRDGLFIGFGQMFSLLPGLPGKYLRRAFYHFTLDSCSLRCNLSFGVLFTKRNSRIGDNVYVGNGALIGSVHLCEGAMVGSRCSLLSGSQLHDLNPDGSWGPMEPRNVRQIQVGSGAWLGEGCIVMANIGAGAMVAAGSVVSMPVVAHVMVAGNPARYVKHVFESDQAISDKQSAR